ncbi:hypothetical protein DUI87_32675 [Hirundo rustica rustica]|uniref:Uncharacterized protein n=1 Tax=Hirundo rustica rustica TaxID=333673 RepID=A0A3M0IQ84_HIRRU|nr:hypothetical protein DUI87_32675 [Hirundo rustica rustica]
MLSLETRGAEGRGKERTGAEKCCVELRGAALKVVLKAVLKAVPPVSFCAGGASSLILITLVLGMRMYVVERSFLVGPPHLVVALRPGSKSSVGMRGSSSSLPSCPHWGGGRRCLISDRAWCLVSVDVVERSFLVGPPHPWLGEERRGEERRGEERRGEERERRGEERTRQETDVFCGRRF